MTRESQSGGDAAMPESDRAPPVPRDVPDLAPGRGAAAAVQEALLELEDFEPAPDEEGREAPGVALPAENWDSVPGWVLPDVLSFDAGQPTLETGAGAGAAPQSGGIGEYREPFASGATASPRNGGPSQGQDGDPSVPGFSGGAVGPAWAPGAGLGPSFETPVSYNVILGTPAGDRLYGTDKPDHIMGLPGSDRLYGGDKADWLQGDDGHDRIYGEAGADKIEGEDGNDRLYGQAGNDDLAGGLGVDYLYGGDGADVLDGGDGSDRLYGQSGHDKLAGGDGNDTLYGGPPLHRCRRRSDRRRRRPGHGLRPDRRRRPARLGCNECRIRLWS
jgi:hypothetical protein